MLYREVVIQLKSQGLHILNISYLQLQNISWTKWVQPIIVTGNIFFFLMSFLSPLCLCREHMTDSVLCHSMQEVDACKTGNTCRGMRGRWFVSGFRAPSTWISSPCLRYYIPVHSCLSQSLIYWDWVNQKQFSRIGQKLWVQLLGGSSALSWKWRGSLSTQP